MKQSLGLRIGQSLAMTPALQQAIRLLQLSSLDLQQEIQQALDANVMLERDEDDLPSDEQALGEPVGESSSDEPMLKEVDGAAEISEEMPVDADWSEVYDDFSPSSKSNSDDDDLQDYQRANQHNATSLREHLMEQLDLAPLNDVDLQIAANLVDAVNDDGYLEDWTDISERLCAELKVKRAHIEAVLALVQNFDPPGIAARDLGECLHLQLQQLAPDTPGLEAALQLITKHLAVLGRRDVQVIAKATGLKHDIIIEALALIRTLQPHPGRPFQPHESNYIAPDVHVSKHNGRWRVSLNPEHSPKLRVNSYYQGFIKRADTSRDQLMLKQHLQEARYFINSLEARNETLLRVAQCIVEEQRAFLDYGDEAMRPLVLRDVSEQLGIHESTVSRATANKFMLTPRGLYELKYFFSSHVQTTQGGVCSATAIQAMIKRLIAGEDVTSPLSDSTIADMLLKEGIQVARRTVAKYREGLHIPPSHERKPSLA
ncbi:RNA polymerase factor sigma-54 [Stenotrophobium rhamnosiphilum]|uniref:RNA polymerase sigma-54 factor n=1 Tax=Stenotrophobium rhamnosiphilum TaxID=2029166 RepID=A0A2T5MBU2_9GAMM|nr:RNA polymerase factor sigma-54 [Stenotrophobium rhamnosiphilum]PTU30049.1 RNA polymerase factor sigma-54 [Stenotrophobium rhamnosiphilum]